MAERTGPSEATGVRPRGFPGWLAVLLILLSVGIFLGMLWRFYP